MRKSISLLIFTILMATDVLHAKGSFTAKGVIGLSYNRRNLDSKYLTKAGGKLHYRHPWGFNAGLLGELHFSNIFSVETGAVYNTNQSNIIRTQKATVHTFIYSFQEQTRYHFITVPVDVILKQKTKSPFYCGAGMTVICNLNSKRTGDYDFDASPAGSFTDDFRMESELGHSLALQGNILIGKNWKVGKGFIGLRLQYNVDVTHWEYPTALDFEDPKGYDMHGHSFSLSFLAGLN